MYYTIYETKNLINSRIYVGYHQCRQLNDDYLGSGKILKEAFEKYGKKNFKKKILYVFPTKEEALLKESEIVNKEFIDREDTYNLKLGGEGGWDHTWNDPKRKEAYKEAHKKGTARGWNLTFEQRSELGKKGFKGKTHSSESKKKIGAAKKLNKKIVEKRLKDYKEIEKTWGWKSKLAKKWNVSHTQVNKFLKDYGGMV
jgi:hypothetical protein